MYNSEKLSSIYLAESCDVFYVEEKNVVLVHWKKYCELEGQEKDSSSLLKFEYIYSLDEV